jgi:hypothetical protein
MNRLFFAGTLVAAICGVAIASVALFSNTGLNDAEWAVARSLSLASLPEIPPDPSNVVADNADAIALGALLFRDAGMSANGIVSCATCHEENRQFQDDLPFAQGIGTTTRRTMPLRGVGYQSWFFWDGRKDSLWSQAMGPIESAVEHGFSRSQVAIHVIATYHDQYSRLFGPLPRLAALPPASPLGDKAQQANWQNLPENTRDEINQIFVNVGKSIAAFERTLVPLENRFDRYINAVWSGQTKASAPIATVVRALRTNFSTILVWLMQRTRTMTAAVQRHSPNWTLIRLPAWADTATLNPIAAVNCSLWHANSVFSIGPSSHPVCVASPTVLPLCMADNSQLLRR